MNNSEKRQIRDAVFAAAREACIFEQPSKPSLPRPTDRRAERLVASALLNGSVAPSTLPCQSSDFADPLSSWVFAYVAALEDMGMLDGKLVDVVLLTKAFARRALPIDRVARELIELRDDVPVAYDLEDLAERVTELAAQRRVIQLMQRVDAAWRLDEGLPPHLVPLLRDELRQWDGSTGGPKP